MMGFVKTPVRTTGPEHAATPAIEDKPLSHGSDSEAAARQGVEPAQRHGDGLRELAAAANILVVEDQALGLHGGNVGSSGAKARKSRRFRVPDPPLTNLQNPSLPMSISIPMVMIVSFSLTLGIMLWQRHIERLATPELKAAAAPLAERRGPSSLAPVHDADEPPPLPRPIKATTPQSVAQRSVESEGDRSPGVVPVAINIWNRRNRHRIEGYVSNTSDKPLSLTLKVVGQGNSVLQLNLPPGARKEFSSDSGFDMQENDRVVVHSEPFQDIVTDVP